MTTPSQAPGTVNGSDTRRRDRLMVIVPDRVSALFAKGEATPRYYNPGSLFREVHLVLTNDDRPDRSRLRELVGDADVHVHNVSPEPRMFMRSAGWRPRLLRRWAGGAVSLAREVGPELIRCHGVHLNGVLAAEIKRSLGVPYVVSLHINPDADLRAWRMREGGVKHQLALRAAVAMENATLREADCVVCVYKFIVPYAERHGARRIEVIYNVVAPDRLEIKTDYQRAPVARAVIVGRQFSKKDPAPVIEALKQLTDVELTLIGNGPGHDRLRRLASEWGVASRCRFMTSVSNEELCRTLREYDVLVSVNDYGGVSKVELEAAHVGLPIVTNRHPLEPEPEVLGSNCIVVDGAPASYASAIRTLMDDESLRASLGTRLREAVEPLRPGAMEQRYIALYRELARTPASRGA